MGLFRPERGVKQRKPRELGDHWEYFCTCQTPQPDGLYQCETCYRLVYRDDY